MQKIMMILMIAVTVSAVMAQTKMSNDGKIEAQIIAREKASWQEWKNKNGAWFQTNLSDEFLGVHDTGVGNKTETVKSIAADCDVKSFTLDNFKFVMMGKDTALLNYAATQDAVCSGTPMPERVRASAVYVNRGGKWMQTFYSEVEAAQENGSVEAQIIALEKQGWEAWKNKDTAFIQGFIPEDGLVISSDGVSNKSQYLKDVAGCEIKSYSLDNFKFVMLDKNAALLTYTATQDGVCGGKKIPSKVRASVNYVRRGGKWLWAMYMETPMAQ
jgi:hypothetical protein